MSTPIPDTMKGTLIPGFPVRQGKVRDVYDLGDNLLVVATDRISAYDVVMPNRVPDKGILLTLLSLFWFQKFGAQFPHHLITADVNQYPGDGQLRPFRDMLRGRSMLVRKAKVLPIECIARGYITGSGWKEYQKTQSVCGIQLPPGLRQCDKLPQSIFTPSTKEETGHDRNIDFAEMAKLVGLPIATELRAQTLALYDQAAAYALERGVIIADTKFEFGQLPDGTIILIDEVLTPDSSRFWPLDEYAPGHDQPSFDKQFVRNYLEELVAAGRWDKTPPAPALPPEVVAGTRARYVEACRLLTGSVPSCWS